MTRLDSYGPTAGGAGCVDVGRRWLGSGRGAAGPGLNTIELAPGPHADFSLRRFASGEYPVETEGADGNSVTLLRVPRDASHQPWFLHIDATQSARVCG